MQNSPPPPEKNLRRYPHIPLRPICIVFSSMIELLNFMFFLFFCSAVLAWDHKDTVGFGADQI